MRNLAAVVLLIVASAVDARAGAAGALPQPHVEVMVAYGAGGSTDLVARTIAQKFQERLGQSFVVLNKAGGSGTIGATLAARAAPDGYTLYEGYTSELVVVPQVSKSVKYSIDDFEPIAVTGLVPLVLISSKKVRADNVQELHRGIARRAGQVHLWRRRRQPAARHGRLVQPAQQAQRHARPLSRRRAGGGRRDRRPCRHVLCRRSRPPRPRSTPAR